MLPQLHGTWHKNMNSINYSHALPHSPDKEIKYENEKENGEDPPGVHINLLDLSEAVALVRLILQHTLCLTDHILSPGPDLDNGGGVLHAPAEVVLVVLAADHGHSAVLTQATALLKFLEQL